MLSRRNTPVSLKRSQRVVCLSLWPKQKRSSVVECYVSRLMVLGMTILYYSCQSFPAHPSMPPKTSREQPSRDEKPSQNGITRQVGRRKRYTRGISTVCEKENGRATEMQRSSFSLGGDSEAQKSPRRRLRWPPKEIGYLKGLRRDGR